MSSPRPPYQELRAAHYVKRTRSSGAGNCVMVGSAAGWIGVQDSKEALPAAQRSTLGFARSRFAAFVRSLKSGA
ncbi:MAG: DUF397 domain-containing protein [Sciscionella sp.]